MKLDDKKILESAKHIVVQLARQRVAEFDNSEVWADMLAITFAEPEELIKHYEYIGKLMNNAVVIIDKQKKKVI